MRVTALGSAGLALAAVTETAERLAAMQAQLASQRKITKPSDNPTGTSHALALRSQTARQTAYDRSTSDATARLSALDGALGGAVGALQRAQDLIRQAGGPSALGTDSAGVIAAQLQAVNTDMLRIANTTDVNGNPVFGGTTTSPAAFDSTGTYLGNSVVATRVVAQGTPVAVSRDGSSIFGSGSTSIFAVLQDAATAVAAGDVAGSNAALAKLDTALKTVSTAQSTVGADETRLQTIASTAQDAKVSTAGQLSDLQDVDIADMAIKLSAANLSYNAALQATAKTSQTSLLDFLR